MDVGLVVMMVSSKVSPKVVKSVVSLAEKKVAMKVGNSVVSKAWLKVCLTVVNLDEILVEWLVEMSVVD